MTQHNVLPFPLNPHEHVNSQEIVTIPTPANYRDGDVYLFLEFGDDDEIPTGMFPESKLFFRSGERRSGMVHALDTAEGVIIVRLRFSGERSECVPYTPGGPSGFVPTSSLKILGWMDEFYSDGWVGPRVVIPVDGRADLLPAAPLVATSPRL
jgi:hypothetical protein